MNVSFEDDLLKPYEEPELDINDTKRIGETVGIVIGKINKFLVLKVPFKILISSYSPIYNWKFSQISTIELI